MRRCLPTLLLLALVSAATRAEAVYVYEFRTLSQEVTNMPCESYGDSYCGGDFWVAGQLAFTDAASSGIHTFTLEDPGILLGFKLETRLAGEDLDFGSFWWGNGYHGGPFLSGIIENGELIDFSALFSHGASDGGHYIAAQNHEFSAAALNPFVGIDATGVWERTVPVPEPGTLFLLAVGLLVSVCSRNPLRAFVGSRPSHSP